MGRGASSAGFKWRCTIKPRHFPLFPFTTAPTSASSRAYEVTMNFIRGQLSTYYISPRPSTIFLFPAIFSPTSLPLFFFFSVRRLSYSSYSYACHPQASHLSTAASLKSAALSVLPTRAVSAVESSSGGAGSACSSSTRASNSSLQSKRCSPKGGVGDGRRRGQLGDCF